MAPTAHVIVYYVRTDGEVIADSLNVELTGILQNHVSYYDTFEMSNIFKNIFKKCRTRKCRYYSVLTLICMFIGRS